MMYLSHERMIGGSYSMQLCCSHFPYYMFSVPTIIRKECNTVGNFPSTINFMLVMKSFAQVFSFNIACSNGSYDGSGDILCPQCSPNSISKEDAVLCDCCPNYYWTYDWTCLSCPANSISQPSSVMCKCVSGYFRTSGENVSVPCTSKQ